ncbi:MAG: VOC family protein [Deltaproteobacteria bacterium]|nr:MAG: VOC family protein [Deltaproteobacteria bacterium]
MPTVTSHSHGNPNWVDLSAHNGEEAAKWYGQLFGWTCEKQETGDPSRPYWMFTLNGETVAGMGQTSEEMKAAGVPPMWNSYFAVDDVDAIVEKAQTLGGRVLVPPMDVMEAGRMAWVTDAEGAAIGLWQANQHIGSTITEDPNTWCWNELDTHDPDKAKAFYEGLFGWTFKTSESSPTLMIYNQDKEIAHTLTIQPSWGDNIPAHWSVYFTVADIDEGCKAVEASGGTIMVPTTQIPVGYFAMVMDPQGALFYLFEFAAQ